MAGNPLLPENDPELQALLRERPGVNWERDQNGIIWGPDSGDARVLSLARGQELGLPEGTAVMPGQEIPQPDFPRFNSADVPPPPSPGDPADGRGAAPDMPPTPPTPSDYASPAAGGLLGLMNQDTMGSAYGIGPGDRGWSQQMARPRYFQIDSPVGPRTIDRFAAQNFKPPGPDQYLHSGTGFQSGRALGFQTAFTLPGWSGGYTVVGYPGDIEGWIPRG